MSQNVEIKARVRDLGKVRKLARAISGRAGRLGTFVELEVVLHGRQPATQGVRVARELMMNLGIRETDLIDRAYIDLLIAKRRR